MDQVALEKAVIENWRKFSIRKLGSISSHEVGDGSYD